MDMVTLQNLGELRTLADKCSIGGGVESVQGSFVFSTVPD
jgi:hypothetical protein